MIELGDQITEVASNQVDDVFLERFCGGDARGLPHRLFGPFDVPPT